VQFYVTDFIHRFERLFMSEQTSRWFQVAEKFWAFDIFEIFVIPTLLSGLSNNFTRIGIRS